MTSRRIRYIPPERGEAHLRKGYRVVAAWGLFLEESKTLGDERAYGNFRRLCRAILEEGYQPQPSGDRGLVNSGEHVV